MSPKYVQNCVMIQTTGSFERRKGSQDGLEFGEQKEGYRDWRTWGGSNNRYNHRKEQKNLEGEVVDTNGNLKS